MQVPLWLTRMFIVDDSIVANSFSLQDGREQGAQRERSGRTAGGFAGKQDESQGSSGEDGGEKEYRGHHEREHEGGNEQDHQRDYEGGRERDQKDDNDRDDEEGGNRSGQRLQSVHEGQRDGVAASQIRAAGIEEGDDSRDFIPSVRPIPLKEYIRHAEQEAEEHAVSGPTEGIPRDIKVVHRQLEQSFHLPENKDIVIREFHVGVNQVWKAIAVFVDGMASTMTVNTAVLEPLMVLPHFSKEADETPSTDRMGTVVQALMPSNQVAVMSKWEEAVNGILTGSTAVFVEGSNQVAIAETKGWEHRSVGLPQTENVVKGPHQAFTESFRANTALVRSMLRSADLVTEMLSVGKLAKTDVAVMYVHGVTNKKLVAEVKRRIEAVDVDYLQDSGILGQFIEDNPRVWLPQSLSTERPDRVAEMLTEGYVAIFVGQSSFVLVVPIVFWTLMQSAEDAYLRFPFGSFLRFLRWGAVMAALLVPGLYVSVTNYHPEMIPTDLMMTIAGSREQVPFPVIIEILMMEFAIELIREAGIRIPSIIGPTIGIVGALIIGQAAVQAGVVSPLLVIVIAVTALASFTIPTYNLQFGVRIMRFVFLLVSAVFGFYGMCLLLVAMVARLSVQKSFGVPLLAPVAPKMDSSRDVFMRGPAYTMNQRPLFLYPQKSWRQEPFTRPWSALAKKSESRIDSTRKQSAGSRISRIGKRKGRS